MAEIGSLSVSLSMDASNFNGSITQVDRNLKAMGSELKAVKAKGSDYGNSLEGLKSKKDILSRSLDASKIKLEETRRKYDEMVASGKANEMQLERQAKKVNDAQAQYNRLETELKEVDDALKKQSSSWTQLSEKIGNASDKLKSAGENMQSVGRDLSMKVTAPIMAMGTGIVMAGANFEESMSKVKAVSGATGIEFTKLEDKAKELGATTKYSASEAANGMQFLAMAGFDTNEILSAMPGMLSLASAGALDLGRAADITSNIMSGFGIEASKAGHVADVLAKAAASANTDVSQLGEAMKYLAPMAQQYNWSVEEATAAVMAMSDAGIQGSMAGQAFSTSLGRLAKQSEETSKTTQKLGMEFFDMEGNMKSLPEVVKVLEEGMAGLDQEQRVATLTTIFGAEAFKHWAVLLEKGSDALADNTNMLVNSTGAAKQMADIMSQNTKGGVKEFQSAVEGLSIQLSEHLLPYVNKGISFLTDLTRSFGKLSPETQKTVLAMGAVVAGIGPVVIITGKLITSVGAIAGAVSTASGAIAGAGGLSAALTVLTGPIGWTVAGLAAVTAGGIALHNHMKQDAIPQIDRFGDSVSEATQKAVGSFLDLNDNATLALNELSWSSKEVTNDMVEKITTNFSEMSTQIAEGLNAKKNQSINVMRELLTNSVKISEEEQQALLASVEKGYSERTIKVEDAEKRIKEIMEIASNEKRALTEVEKNEINSIQQQMVNEGIKVLTDNEREQTVIFERMKQNAGELSALQAAEVVKNSVEQKEKVVTEAEDQYNKAIAEIIKMRDEANVISKEQADMLIKEAERQKNETISRAEDQHLRIIEEAQNQANEHVDLVDWETGEVLSKWQVFKQNFSRDLEIIRSNASNNWNRMKDDTVQKYTEMRDGASERVNQMVENTKAKFDEKVQSVRDKMSETKQSVMDTWNQAEQFLKDIDLTQIGKDIIQGLIDGVGSMANAVWEKARSIASSIKDAITSFFDIRSPSRVMMEMGGHIGEGLEIGMENTIRSISKAANEMARAAVPKFNTNYQSSTSSLGSASIGKSITQNITINSPQPLSANDIIRKQRQLQQQLAMEF